jgi:hypothetical protein
MSKFFVTLCLLMASCAAFACTIPKRGPEYDKLIQVKKVSGDTFLGTVSKEAEGLHYGAQISIDYVPNKAQSKPQVYSGNVIVKEESEDYIASFELNKIDGYKAYVKVYWQPEQCCLCGAYGTSEEITFE